jgi:hypothetical protein
MYSIRRRLFASQRTVEFSVQYQTEEEITDESGFIRIAASSYSFSLSLPDLFDADEWVKLENGTKQTA